MQADTLVMIKRLYTVQLLAADWNTMPVPSLSNFTAPVLMS